MTENISTCIDKIQAKAQKQKELAETTDNLHLRDEMNSIINQCTALRILITTNDMEQHHKGYMEGLNKADELVTKALK